MEQQNPPPSTSSQPTRQQRTLTRFLSSLLTLLILPAAFFFLPVHSLEAWREQNWLLALGIFALIAGLVVWVLVKDARDDAAPDMVLPAIDQAAADLAKAVSDEWKNEVGSRDLSKLLPVTLRPTTRSLIRSGPSVGEQEVLLRTTEDAMEAYLAIPSRRCVILGEPGTGKTTTAVLLTRQLLESWKPELQGKQVKAVPVFVSLADWKPLSSEGAEATGLLDWMSSKLSDQYRFLNDKRYGDNVAMELIRTGRVRPVLDGLDEIGIPDDPAGTKALQAEALSQISEAADAYWSQPAEDPAGLVLTCRVRDLEATMGAGGVRGEIEDARVVEVQTLDLKEAKAFIMKGATGVQRAHWDTWLDTVTHGEPVAEAFSRPLFVSLARGYRLGNGAPDDLQQCRDVRSVERKLLTHLVESAYAKRPGGAADRWGSTKAERWLGFVAKEMNVRGLRAFTWWDLPSLLGRAHSLLAGLIGFLLIAPAVAMGIAIVFSDALGTAQAVVLAGVIGLVVGSTFGWLSMHTVPPPAEMHFGKSGRARSIAVSGLLVGALGAAAGMVAGGPTLEHAIMGLMLAAPIAIAYAGATIDASVRVAGSGRLMHNDIVVALVFTLAYGVPIALVTATVAHRPVLGIVFGLWAGLAGGLTYGLPWLVTLRPERVGVIAVAHLVVAQLISRGRLPWQVIPFLEEACNRGVLQRVGPAYEFRHADLQEVLADRAK
ncbi:NACHT domain-containing protein [Luteipulveratus mongoliensis]|uniref:NACHT domain-containing protein n=1 Tax=Luteipulveratus mongoliensis TaxID=571913 RepID=A0A0K1JKR9_9MICO|nr:hypothetical protein [Luteipulveratus mongoliensis]AKU17307.1 hypothetical protein VV02_18035 [Luteipulveratus mongoliensis]